MWFWWVEYNADRFGSRFGNVAGIFMVGTSYVSYYSVHANTLVIGPLFTTLERWKI